MPTPKLIVVVEGASIIAVVSNDPALIGTDIHVIDYDAEESPTDADIQVITPSGGRSPAFYTVRRVEEMAIGIPAGAVPRPV